MKITLKQLQRVFEKILEKLSKDGYKAIEFGDSDLYWTVVGSERKNMSNPPNLAVGSLLDDLEEIKTLLSDDDRPTTYVDFDRVASILNSISEQLNPSSN